MVDNPDIVKVHKVEHCGHCGESLKGEEVLGVDRRQVFDLPPIKVQVTEHQAEIKECDRCGKLTTAEFPLEVTHKVQYGPGLKATAAYIKSNGLLSYERATELFEDLFGVPPERRDLGECGPGDRGTLGRGQRKDQGADSVLAGRTF
jgi:transposase